MAMIAGLVLLTVRINDIIQTSQSTKECSHESRSIAQKDVPIKTATIATFNSCFASEFF